MKFEIYTKRFLLRELRESDLQSFFEMDSNPNVHRFLNNNPIKNLDEAENMIHFIRSQYEKYGIGRWAIINRQTNEFVGWSGLKYITDPINNNINFYEVDYRLAEKFWGKGIATETAAASLKYAFEVMKIDKVIGMCDVNNIASKIVLEKIGLKVIEDFEYHTGQKCHWLEITKDNWLNNLS